MIITLNPAEFREAALIGAQRQIDNVVNEVADAYGFNGDPWSSHIEAACAEKLVARETEQYWHGSLGKKDKGPDVGDDGVRHTKYRAGHLLLHKEDDPDRYFWLVIGVAPRLEIIGGLHAREGQQEDYWSHGERPCYFVPQSALIKWEGEYHIP